LPEKQGPPAPLDHDDSSSTFEHGGIDAHLADIGGDSD